MSVHGGCSALSGTEAIDDSVMIYLPGRQRCQVNSGIAARFRGHEAVGVDLYYMLQNCAFHAWSRRLKQEGIVPYGLLRMDGAENASKAFPRAVL